MPQKSIAEKIVNYFETLNEEPQGEVALVAQEDSYIATLQKVLEGKDTEIAALHQEIELLHSEHDMLLKTINTLANK